MPHKVITKLYGVEAPGVQAPLELYFVSCICSALNFCTGLAVELLQPLLVCFAAALLRLFAGAPDWQASGFIRTSYRVPLMDLETEKKSKNNWIHRIWGPPDT